MASDPSDARSVSEIDWPNWKPTDHATLLFVIRRGEVLLIHKKRGLGAGKINGPGGRIEAGETAAECAVREVEEELGIRAIDPEWCGEHHFQFVDGYGLQVQVFKTDRFEGEPIETDEAIPLWVPIDAVPYDSMWADDRHWFPHLFAGRPFRGFYIFDGDAMLDLSIELDPPRDG
ncbi:MAG: 8-oxo-dGTP diphosphatase [Myxococcota bacterium]|nr:8-oxo-dGTP diphosphatase [Myxococcota bacterium]